MPSREIKITITVKGPPGAGKSLAISDLKQALKDSRHFIVIDKIDSQISMSTIGEESVEFRAKLRYNEPIEHEG